MRGALRWAVIVSIGVFTIGLGARVTARQDPAAKAQADAIQAIKTQIAGHENDPAEAVFKNIDLLKGKNASVLPSMMAALPGLLGVDCAYCHVPGAWEKDDKPTKQRAREMFRMIKGINGDYFGGKNAVSCWTCHRGNPHPPLSGGGRP